MATVTRDYALLPAAGLQLLAEKLRKQNLRPVKRDAEYTVLATDDGTVSVHLDAQGAFNVFIAISTEGITP